MSAEKKADLPPPGDGPGGGEPTGGGPSWRAAPHEERTWAAFSSRHPGHPFLAEDPLYALTEEVINAISTSSTLPGFFSPDEEDFERDLYLTTGHGFFHRRPIGRLP